MENFIIIMLALLVWSPYFAFKYHKEHKRKEEQARIAAEKAREQAALQAAKPYLELDKVYGILTVKRCCPEVASALKIVKHYTESGTLHPATYTYTAVTVGGITTGGITEHAEHYDSTFQKTSKVKLIYDKFVIEKIRLERKADIVRAYKYGVVVGRDGMIDVTNKLTAEEKQRYDIEVRASVTSWNERGYYTNSYEEMRFPTFEKVKKILDFLATSDGATSDGKMSIKPDTVIYLPAETGTKVTQQKN